MASYGPPSGMAQSPLQARHCPPATVTPARSLLWNCLRWRAPSPRVAHSRAHRVVLNRHHKAGAAGPQLGRGRRTTPAPELSAKGRGLRGDRTAGRFSHPCLPSWPLTGGSPEGTSRSLPQRPAGSESRTQGLSTQPPARLARTRRDLWPISECLRTSSQKLVQICGGNRQKWAREAQREPAPPLQKPRLWQHRPRPPEGVGITGVLPGKVGG